MAVDCSQSVAGFRGTSNSQGSQESVSCRVPGFTGQFQVLELTKVSRFWRLRAAGFQGFRVTREKEVTRPDDANPRNREG